MPSTFILPFFPTNTGQIGGAGGGFFYMKKIISSISFFVALFLLGTGCQKDETKTVIGTGTASTLSVSSNNLVLKGADAKNEAVKFTWTKASYGFDAAFEYTLQIDKKGNNFAKPTNYPLATLLELSANVADFNNKMLLLGLVAEVSNELEARVKAEVPKAAVDILYSAPITLTVTPYLAVVDYQGLYVPGSHQGWKPDIAPKIVSKKNDKKYEGYVNFPDATTEFKFTDSPNWDNKIYGDEAGGATGKIQTTGNGDNMKANAAGYYLLKADLTANTWSAVSTSWGIIGSATADGNNSDQNLTFDAATNTWTITTNLKVGDFKFRANDANTIVMGDPKGNGALDYNASAVKIAADGNYTIIFNLGIPGNYRYTLKKN
jgi:hypothetical protein